jgi:DNA-binding transcriptional LysR family regulator
MTAGLLPAIIDRFSRRYPQIVVRVIQANMSLDFRELQGRNVDLMLSRSPEPFARDDLDVEILFNDAFVLAAGVNSKWLRRRKIDVAELVNETWCLPPYDMFVGSLIAEAFRARGLSVPRHTVASTSVHLHLALLATGRFLSVLSASTCLERKHVRMVHDRDAPDAGGDFLEHLHELAYDSRLSLVAEPRDVAARSRQVGD